MKNKISFDKHDKKYVYQGINKVSEGRIKMKKSTMHFKTVLTIIISSVITFSITMLWLYGSTNKTQTSKNPLTEVVKNDKMSTKLEMINNKIKSEYFGEIDEEKLSEYALKGYVLGLGDPYSEYFSYDEMQDFTEDTLGNYVGIGVYITKDDEKEELIIYDTVKNSPAEQAGIKAGDIIRKVNDKEYTVEDFDTIANEIKGKEGTKVKLVIERDGEEKSFEIERKSVELIRVTSQMLEDNIGYIYMSTFDGNVAEQIRKEYKDLKSKGATSLIIDIRNNGGGLVEEAVEIGDMLTDKGTTLLIQKDNKDKEKTYKSEKDKEIDMNFVLLTNNYSASASEILAAIVKEKVPNGKIVGMTTYGKGVIQTLYTLADGSGLKLTTDEYFTPNHETINEKGVTPDYVVEGKFDSKELDVNNDKQLKKAIEVLKNNF